MIVGVDGGGRSREIRPDTDAGLAQSEAPRLGIVTVGRQRGEAQHILAFRVGLEHSPKLSDGSVVVAIVQVATS